MPAVLVTGAARANSIAAGIVPRLVAEGWDVYTSELDSGDYPCDLSDAEAAAALVGRVVADHGPLQALVLSHAHVTGNLPYGASKGALDRIVISAAREFGPRGISANVVNPGPIATGWMDAATREALGGHHPLGRLGTPGDIAGIVAFLVSDEGRWISGQLLNTDGGFSARY